MVFFGTVSPGCFFLLPTMLIKRHQGDFRGHPWKLVKEINGKYCRLLHSIALFPRFVQDCQRYCGGEVPDVLQNATSYSCFFIRKEDREKRCCTRSVTKPPPEYENGGSMRLSFCSFRSLHVNGFRNGRS